MQFSKKIYFTSFVFILVGISSFSSIVPSINHFFEQKQLDEERKRRELNRNAWIDSTYKALSPKQRISQLFMMPIWGERNELFKDTMVDLVKNHQIGGIIFMRGTPERQVDWLNQLQAVSNLPMLVAMDAEYGLAMRLKNTVKMPNQMTMGAISDNKLIEKMGAAMAQQCLRVGTNVSFSPVADVNNNPNNPVINFRSFGEDKYAVADKAIAYMNGLQKNGVMACAKHFPGHGDTDADSHLTLPIITANQNRIDTLELYPFKALFNAGIQSVMVAHLFIPALDSTPNRASTLSPKIVTDLMKIQLNYKGLIFTDALNMQGVAKFYPAGVVEVEALKAGNDVLLFPADVVLAIEKIELALKNKILSHKQIETSVKKILGAKYDLGLNKKYEPISQKNLIADLNQAKYHLINREIYGNALTLINNSNNDIPFKKEVLYDKKFGVLSIGTPSQGTFPSCIALFAANTQAFEWNKNTNKNQLDTLISQLKNVDNLIVGVHLSTQKPINNFGIDTNAIIFLNELHRQKPFTLVLFGNPYALKNFQFASNLLCSYEDNHNVYVVTAEALFGSRAIVGQLPITVNPDMRLKQGLFTKQTNNLTYTYPESVGIQSIKLQQIDSLVKKAMDNSAFAGCQVLVSVKNKVIYTRNFGFMTYDKTQAIDHSTIYDLASVSKILSTNLAVMKLVDQQKINLDSSLSFYLPQFKNTNKTDLRLREILSHQAGLKSWIPYYKETLLGDNALNPLLYNTTKKAGFGTQVAKNLYLKDTYKDTIFKRIAESPITGRGSFLYSDLGLILMQQIVEQLTQTPLNIYVENNFYRPMGVQSIGYLPINRLNVRYIAPTENDLVFRKQTLRGYVHDPAAAMLGGVAGHAGLFGSANDVARVGNMLLNNGTYASQEFISRQTIQNFTKKQYPNNRRGLGFERPTDDPNDKKNPTAKSASIRSFGHSGFTGTYIWIDPDHDLVFVFLSNRVHPNTEPNKLAQMNTRTDILETVYQAIKK